MNDTKKARIIAFANQKGGVGKTTTTRAMGTALARRGKKVLLIDFDPQSNLTSCALRRELDDEGQPLEIDFPERTITDVVEYLIDHKIAAADELDLSIENDLLNVEDGLWLFPADCYLSNSEISMSKMQIGSQMILKIIIDKIKKEINFDYILIDCQPSLGLLAINAFVASDEIVVPLEPDDFSIQGVQQLVESIHTVKRYGFNNTVRFSGLIFTKYDPRTNEAKRMVSRLEEKIPTIQQYFGDSVKVFDAKIPYGTKAREANRHGISVIEHDPHGKLSRAYQSLAEELDHE
jgi:ATPases involved in chromosome partitioning